MWPLAGSGLVVGLLGALLLGVYRHVLYCQTRSRCFDFRPPLMVGFLTLGGFFLAHMGMNYSWTGKWLVADWSWLALAAAFVGALTAACLLLWLQQPSRDQWMLCAVAALVALGLINLYVWEARDANAYVSTVGLPELRILERSVGEDTSLSDEAKERFKRVLGTIPNELEFEAAHLGRAIVVNPNWLHAYNDSVDRVSEALTALPPAEADKFTSPRRIDLFPATERQLEAAILGLLLAPIAFAMAARMPSSRLWRSHGAMAAVASAPLLLISVSAVARGGRALPASIPVGTQDISAFEIVKLVVVVSLAVALGQRGTARGARRMAVTAAFVAAGTSILGLALLDGGAGTTLLLVAAIMVTMTLSRCGRRVVLAGAVLAVLLTPGAVRLLGDSVPQSVRVRLEMWSDPSGAFKNTEITNEARATLERMVVARASEPPARLASHGPGKSEPLPSAVSTDVEHLIQELRYRLDALDQAEATASPFIPGADPAEERVLAEADNLWFRFGTTSAQDGLSSARQRIDALAFDLREALNEAIRAQLLSRDTVTSSASDTGVSNLWLPSPEPDNFQLQRALFALRAGGRLGVGLGLGQPEAIPDVSQDAALAAVGESLGLAGSAIVLLLVAAICLRSLEWASGRQTGPESLLMAGLSVLLLTQVVLSTGGVAGVLPFTGLTFPFLSQGGTSLVSNLIIIGIMLGLAASSRGVGAGATPVATGDSPPQALAPNPVRWGVAATLAPLLLALALTQLCGRSLAPGVFLRGLEESTYPAESAGDQWQAPPYRQVAGAITDRHGVVLAETQSLGGSRVYPDEALATSLAQTLAQLDLAVSSGELKPSGGAAK
jgi:cell division protein FtsW (lipid II flippase)